MHTSNKFRQPETGILIKNARRAKKLTMKQIEELTEIDQGTLSRLENGAYISSAGIKHVEKLFEILDIDTIFPEEKKIIQFGILKEHAMSHTVLITELEKVNKMLSIKFQFETGTCLLTGLRENSLDFVLLDMDLLHNRKYEFLPIVALNDSLCLCILYSKKEMVKKSLLFQSMFHEIFIAIKSLLSVDTQEKYYFYFYPEYVL